eukprot:UN24304
MAHLSKILTSHMKGNHISFHPKSIAVYFQTITIVEHVNMVKLPDSSTISCVFQYFSKTP